MEREAGAAKEWQKDHICTKRRDSSASRIEADQFTKHVLRAHLGSITSYIYLTDKRTALVKLSVSV